jgi:hypothetical protein
LIIKAAPQGPPFFVQEMVQVDDPIVKKLKIWVHPVDYYFQKNFAAEALFN